MTFATKNKMLQTWSFLVIESFVVVFGGGGCGGVAFICKINYFLNE